MNKIIVMIFYYLFDTRKKFLSNATEIPKLDILEKNIPKTINNAINP